MINRNRAYTILVGALIFLLFIINLLLTVIIFAQYAPDSWLSGQLSPTLAGFCGSYWDPDVQTDYG